MKKTLPVIFTLIFLSLFGLILFQASWLRNLLKVRHEQLHEKIQKVGAAVAIYDLGNTIKSPRIRVPRLGRIPFGLNMPNFVKPIQVSDKFSERDIYKKLKTAFDKEELKDLQFDFAVVNQNNELEFASPDFEKTLYDSINNEHAIFPIVPSTSLSDFPQTDSFEQLYIVIPNFQKQVWNSVRWIIVFAALFMIIIIAAFYVTVKAMLQQKKNSEIKNDFINNMTHELKTPLATISLAVDALKNERVIGDKEKTNYFTNIIKEENKRMNKHVESILQAALIEKQEELKMHKETLHANDIIEQVVEIYQLQIKQKKGEIILNLNAQNDLIDADENHFGNMVSNLIDNAIKYSKEEEHLQLKISTQNNDNVLKIIIEDNGIGMNKETVKRIFEKFYRAHTGNVHNVKGFGLGMSYVKSVLEAHKGSIKIDSTLGKGSIFTLEIPLSSDNIL